MLEELQLRAQHIICMIKCTSSSSTSLSVYFILILLLSILSSPLQSLTVSLSFSNLHFFFFLVDNRISGSSFTGSSSSSRPMKSETKTD